MPTIEHVSDDRLEQIETDLRGLCMEPDDFNAPEWHNEIDAIRREKQQRGNAV